ARPILQGTELAVEELNRGGGVDVGGHKVRLVVRRTDNDLSPQQATAHVRSAAVEPAVAVISDGTGVDGSWAIANRAGVPIGVVYQGGEGLVDAQARPNVFRIAPTDHGASFRLAEYLVPRGVHLAIVTDDSAYGADGAAALARAFARNRSSVVAAQQVPAAGDPGPQVLDARRRGDDSLLVWARPGPVAVVLR